LFLPSASASGIANETKMQALCLEREPMTLYMYKQPVSGIFQLNSDFIFSNIFALFLPSASASASGATNETENTSSMSGERESMTLYIYK
jgi:hypothetical protein